MTLGPVLSSSTTRASTSVQRLAATCAAKTDRTPEGDSASAKAVLRLHSHESKPTACGVWLVGVLETRARPGRVTGDG